MTTTTRVSYGYTGTVMHAAPDTLDPVSTPTTALCGESVVLGTGDFTAAITTGTKCPSCVDAADPEAAAMDATMRAQMATDPEAGGPRDPAIGPHPRFAEMDAHRAQRLDPVYVADKGATAQREGDRIVFTLTRHGLATLAAQFHATPSEMAATARRIGWQVEE